MWRDDDTFNVNLISRAYPVIQKGANHKVAALRNELSWSFRRRRGLLVRATEFEPPFSCVCAHQLTINGATHHRTSAR
jgi:hypothetical protein